MLYILHGSDFKKSREKLKSMVTSLLKKKPDASFFKVDSSNFSVAQLDEFIGGQGLFEQKYIVQMDGLLNDKKTTEIVLDKIEDISKSENIFILIEDELNKTILKKIEKNAQQVQEFGNKEDGRKFAVIGGGELNLKEFNIFSLGDALGNRDKKTLWVLYQKTVNLNIPAEETYGILFWQLKSILLAKKSKNAEESGLKPFVYSKSARFAKNFQEDELKKMSADLINMYHNSRRGLLDFGVALEKFILMQN